MSAKNPLWREVQQLRPEWDDGRCRAAAATLRMCRSNMLMRCNDPTRREYPRYGGRGITVCPEWADPDSGTAAFACWALSAGWKPELQIDRLDNDGGYSPDNCRWVSCTENNNNRGNNHKIPIPVTTVRGLLGCNGVRWAALMECGTEAIAAELLRLREGANAERTQRKERLMAGKCPICGRETTHVYRAPASNHHLIVVGCPHCAELTDIYTAACDAGAVKG